MKIAICFVVAFVYGCTGNHKIDPDDIDAVARSVSVERDDFMGVLMLKGPLISNRQTSTTDAPEVEEVSLHAVKPKDRPERYFIDVTDYYDGNWRGFDQAFDISGNKFHALVARHHAECKLFCGFDEQIEIEVSKKYLDEHADTGILMRLYGPGSVASAPFLVPGGYIKGFLKTTAENKWFSIAFSHP